MRFAGTVKIVLPLVRELNFEGQRGSRREEKGNHNVDIPKSTQKLSSGGVRTLSEGFARLAPRRGVEAKRQSGTSMGRRKEGREEKRRIPDA